MAVLDNRAILILAAGESSRMGSPKQLLAWGDTTLLNHVIQTAKKCSVNVYVVLGANAESVKNSILDNTTCFLNENWKDGMGSSVSFGIKQLLANKPTTKSCLILLADQPLVDSDFLTKLWDTFENINPKIVATDYGNSMGVPAIFGSDYFSKLMKLTGGKGAKSVLITCDKDVFGVDGKDKVVDVDTPNEYKNIVNNTFK